MHLPTEAMAQAIAGEWAAQGEELDPLSMPVTRSANSAIDRVATQHREVAEMLAAYAETDLLCHRADGPERLRQRQDAGWDPLLDWAEERFGARLVPVTGNLADQAAAHRTRPPVGGGAWLRSLPSDRAARSGRPIGLPRPRSGGGPRAAWRRRTAGRSAGSMKTGRSSNGARTSKPPRWPCASTGNSRTRCDSGHCPLPTDPRAANFVANAHKIRAAAHV